MNARKFSAALAARWVMPFVIGAAVLAGPLKASAQLAGKGAVTGTVTDSEGAAIPNAEVDVIKVATGIVTKTTTTGSGDYNISTLDPGEYTVVVTAPGFERLTQQHVQVNALESVTVSPKLTVGAATESVTVTSAPPQLETTNATIGATMDSELYSSLPVEMGAYGQPGQRRATDFAFLMPGVQGNNTNGNATTNTGVVNGAGPRGAVSGVYLDGVVFVRAGGNGDPRYIWTAISVDAVDQFQLQTTGYPALYEGQGIQNYVIKQGGNKFHGSVYEFIRNTALDTWGFFGPAALNPITGKPQKPVEHSNEYGINLSGPLLPFGGWRDKLFFFGNYNGFRYVNTKPTTMTFPNLAEQSGNFQGAIPFTVNGVSYTNSGAELSCKPGQAGGCAPYTTSPTAAVPGVYDPNSQAACTANSTNGPCRYRYGYVFAGTAGPYGNPVLGPGGTAAVDVIPASQFSPVALALQKNIPALNNQALQSNYISQNRTMLNNWSHTERVDWVISSKDSLTLVSALGRQASGFPQGQTTSGRNAGPLPYNYGQAFAPKTAVGIIEETHTFSPHVVNQLKYGFARYNGPTFNADYNPAFGATNLGGITNLPAGQASGAFPIVQFSGSNAPTNWGGTTASVTIAQNFTLVDNVQWQFGKHSLTIGAQIAWLEYLNQSATGGTTPLTLGTSVTQTAEINPAGTAGSYTVGSTTGIAYASFLLAQFNSSSLTAYQRQEYASRFRAISPYVQDNWKVTQKLTLDLGLRWDYFPPVREVSDAMSFFDPNTINPVTGIGGSLVFAGNGPNTCNCDTPINTYMKNFGPRLGFAYQSDPNTVWRGSWGVMFSHGDAVGGGNASSLGGANISQGFSASSTTSATGQDLGGLVLNNGNLAYPAVAVASGRSTSPAFGTGYTTTTGYTGSPNSVAYLDPYLGSRAPEFINYSFGFQHQWTSTFVSTITYVGSQGHFLTPDSGNARGHFADQLDPQYLSLGSNLSLTGSSLTAFCASHSGVCPSYTGIFNTGQSLAQLLKPFPFHSVSDLAGQNVGNSNYNALQMIFQMRPVHGFTLLSNYTWSHAIDDAGTFRSGYAIPQQYSNTDKSWAADRIERTTSLINQKHHFVFTGTWKMPFGVSMMKEHLWERALLGGFNLSTVFQAYTGSPLAITGASCPSNPAQSTCMPNYAGNFPLNSNVMTDTWGHGVTYANFQSKSFINSAAFAYPAAYTFGNLSRTAPYNLYGPGNYNWDLALVRTFPIWEHVSLNFRAELYNVTNHTQFTVASTVYGNSAFGQVSGQANQSRQAQFSGRLNF